VHEPEALVLHGDDAGPDVQDVADAQLPEIPDVTLHGAAHAAASRQGLRIETHGVQERVPGVVEPREVEGHGEVVDAVDLPPVHGAAVRFEPAHFRGQTLTLTYFERGAVDVAAR